MFMNQKKLTILTLVVVVAGAVTVNELIMRVNNKDQSREVASFGERYVPEQIKWEQELAKTVSKDTNGKTLIGAKPSISEKFLYEALEGHYDAQVVDGKLLKISLRENNDPVSLDIGTAITKYNSVFKNSANYTIQNTNSKNESVVLKDTTGNPTGIVTVTRTAEGRVLNIEIK